MRVVTATCANGRWMLGLVGTQSERFHSVTLTDAELEGLSIAGGACGYDGDGALLRLGLQAYALGIAWEFDPYFGLSISRVDPLPHQLAAVYDHLLKLARVRFLLADDAGAGKTIMAGLLNPGAETARARRARADRRPRKPRVPVAAGAEGEARRGVHRPRRVTTSATSSASTSGSSSAR